jgi:hypothetical protein
MKSLTSEVEVLHVGATVRQAAQDAPVNIASAHRRRCPSAVGVLTDRDIVLRLVADNRKTSTAVEQVMSKT